MRNAVLALVAVAAVSMWAPSNAAAQIQATPASGYGLAGCGLGSMVFGNQPGIIQVLAATTNGTFGTQTFGITSGTSNCIDSATPILGAKNFVKTNRQALARDMARGKGETIDALAKLAGCKDSRTVGQTLQQNFRRVFSSPALSDDKVSESVVEVLQTTTELSCGNLVVTAS